MNTTMDLVTIKVPRAFIDGLAEESASSTERMHALLERNTEGTITQAEHWELKFLVRLAKIGQILNLGLELQSRNSP